MLTRKQRDLLLYINDYVQENGVSPSFEEMKDALELKSKSGIHRLINALEERGFIEKLAHKARALEIKRLPEDVMLANVVTGDFSPKVETSNVEQVASLPLYGKIAAGTPIEALRHEQETVEVPLGFLGPGESYALTVEGDSMMKAGIMDGDIVIIERTETANNGDIVVALVDGEEVTLKRMYRDVGKIVLQPENDAYQAQVLPAERVQIQGRLRSLFRYY